MVDDRYPPEQVPVVSSDLLSVGYASKQNELWVRFRTSSSVCYVYSDVPAHVYTDLMTAASLGRFFHQNVRDVYQRPRRE